MQGDFWSFFAIVSKRGRRTNAFTLRFSTTFPTWEFTMAFCTWSQCFKRLSPPRSLSRTSGMLSHWMAKPSKGKLQSAPLQHWIHHRMPHYQSCPKTYAPCFHRPVSDLQQLRVRTNGEASNDLWVLGELGFSWLTLYIYIYVHVKSCQRYISKFTYIITDGRWLKEWYTCI